MPSDHDDMATKPPQSLPSFAQTFGGTPSLHRLAEPTNALPPLQHRPFEARTNHRSSAHSSPQPQSAEPKQTTRKRLHAESSAADKDERDSLPEGRRSPRIVRIKEEADYDSVPPTSHSRPVSRQREERPNNVQTTQTLITTSASPNPSKRRRVTISTMSQPINTDVRRPSVDSGISPVVMGFTIQRDDPAALEQVRSMLTVKQKQKELIEQRRNSLAGIPTPTPTAPPTVNIVNPRPGSEERQGTTPKPSGRTTGGRSPNISGAGNSVTGAAGPRRSIVTSSAAAPPPPPPSSQITAHSSTARAASPAAPIVPTQQHLSQQPRRESTTTSQSVPPPGPGSTSSSGPPPPTSLSSVSVPVSSHLPPPPTTTTSHSLSATTSASTSASSAIPTTPSAPSGLPAPPPPTNALNTINALPAPSISFSRRRAGKLSAGGKSKPADIMISPRDTHSDPSLQPIIQSAPPIPRTGPPSRMSSMSSMAIPTIPSVIGNAGSHRRVGSGQVPPTPTRLAMLQQQQRLGHVAGISGVAQARSPPNASVPIATSLVPPVTPASFHHPGYSMEKSAFLAPFETFYDALNDSKQLKVWLGEQLQKAAALNQSLTKQQETMEETVKEMVDKKVEAMREEVYGLRVRMEELEQALRSTASANANMAANVNVGVGVAGRGSGSSSGYSPNMTNASSSKAKGKATNGYPPHLGVVPDTYTFPAVDPLRRPEPMRRASSPNVEREKFDRERIERMESESQSRPPSHSASPISFESRRLSVSAIRLDPPRASDSLPPPPGPSRASFSSHSRDYRDPRDTRDLRDMRERERDPRESMGSYGPPPPPPPSHQAQVSGWSPRMSKSGLPTSSTRSSLNQTLSSSDLPGGLRHSTSAPGVSVGERNEREGSRIRYSIDSRMGYDRERDLERERDREKARDVDRYRERERVSLRERESNIRGEERDRDSERGRESNMREEVQMRSPASSRRRNSVSSPSGVQRKRGRSPAPMDTSP
ncbi:hypothetical protein QCA50_007006 [Cerrena zonata]|uniref:Uncharacterized protein n=1 Tax=Cerrena zonata TaxID=2478898 RepID=A0AAW0GGI7_9APHY